MSETPEQLADRIRLGEDSSLELKEVTVSRGRITGPRRDQRADELAAFANASGGTLVLGVEDRTRRVTGIPLLPPPGDPPAALTVTGSLPWTGRQASSSLLMFVLMLVGLFSMLMLIPDCGLL